MLISKDSDLVKLGCILYFVGAGTDYIDGWLARKYKIESTLGKFIDPLADKILTTAAFLAMVFLDLIPLWMVVVIIIRDFGTTALRVGAEARGLHIATLYSAQVKTFIQMTYQMIVLALIFLESSFKGQFFFSILNFQTFGIKIVTAIMFLLTMITLFTLAEYLYKNKKTISLILNKSRMIDNQS